MPEIKNNFLQGKMNKDLDERLVPSGQYRDAWNIEISTAEDSGAGTIKNILGNKRVEDYIPSDKFECVGSIADENTNKLYWFISSYEKDAIIEYDVENDLVNPVIVDLNAGTYKAVLKFSGNIITGINIIDDLLFWTDNNTDPKKINIKECIKGTPKYDDNGVALNVHTQLLFDSGSFNGITLKYVAKVNNLSYLYFKAEKKGKYFWFNTNQLQKLFNRELEYAQSHFTNPYEQYKVRHYRNGEFLGEKRIKAWDGVTLSSNGSHGRAEPYVYSPGEAPFVSGTPESEYWPWQIGDIIFGKDVNIDIEERHITVIKPKPTNAFSIKINHNKDPRSSNDVPNLFETKFPRFSYRYKYRDGEFSAFASSFSSYILRRYNKTFRP
jgi:hypothetical protein